MAAEFTDVPDSTDWLNTPLSGLAAVEAALRCQVCKDLYRTPMQTSCSHTFCSLCIRHALAHDGRCPLCRSTDQESKLRNNWSMDEIVEAFSKSRSDILKFAKQGPPREPRSPKRKATDQDASAFEEPATKKLRSSARLSASRTQESPATSSLPERIVVPDSEDEDDQDDTYSRSNLEPLSSPPSPLTFPAVPDDGMVACPICDIRMKEQAVFKHLDTCGQTPRPSPMPKLNGESSRSSNSSIAQTTRQQPPSKPFDRDRLPAVNYSILKDIALRKKMAELGLSTSGTRPLLERRHKEWVTIWNANCDSSRPKRRNELMHDLVVWERTQGGQTPGSFGGGPVRAAGMAVKDKEFDAAAWGSKHDTSFRDLIANARKSKADAQKPKQSPEANEQITEAGNVRPSTEESGLTTTGEGMELDITEQTTIPERTLSEGTVAATPDHLTPVATPSAPTPSGPCAVQDNLENPPPVPIGRRTRSSQEA